MLPLNIIITKPLEIYKMCIDYKWKEADCQHEMGYLTMSLFRLCRSINEYDRTRKEIYTNKKSCGIVLVLEGILKNSLNIIAFAK